MCLDTQTIISQQLYHESGDGGANGEAEHEARDEKRGCLTLILGALQHFGAEHHNDGADVPVADAEDDHKDDVRGVGVEVDGRDLAVVGARVAEQEQGDKGQPRQRQAKDDQAPEMGGLRPLKHGSQDPADKVANVEDQEATDGNEIGIVPRVSLKDKGRLVSNTTVRRFL